MNFEINILSGSNLKDTPTKANGNSDSKETCKLRQ